VCAIQLREYGFVSNTCVGWDHQVGDWCKMCRCCLVLVTATRSIGCSVCQTLACAKCALQMRHLYGADLASTADLALPSY
jgi:hypothetical protein